MPCKHGDESIRSVKEHEELACFAVLVFKNGVDRAKLQIPKFLVERAHRLKNAGDRTLPGAVTRRVEHRSPARQGGQGKLEAVMDYSPISAISSRNSISSQWRM